MPLTEGMHRLYVVDKFECCLLKGGSGNNLQTN